MELARGRIRPLDSIYENLHGGIMSASSSVLVLEDPPSSADFFGCCSNGGGSLSTLVNYPSISHMAHISTFSDLTISSTSAGGDGSLVLATTTDSSSRPVAEPHHSILSFKSGCGYPEATYSSSSPSSKSMLSFKHAVQHHQLEDYAMFAEAFDEETNLRYGNVDSRILSELNCLDSSMGGNRCLVDGAAKDGRNGEEQFGWLYSDVAAVGDELLENEGPELGVSHKRPYVSGEVQHCKRHKKAKSKPSTSKDPQSIAAKNRRERISERLKTLQDLVPNGTKVDLVTMLEKAISYVKFLQLQVKVLATDELWPSQGGKAPEIGQVKEAIEAILSSHREKNSGSR